jgi:hypothetical protein
VIVLVTGPRIWTNRIIVEDALKPYGYHSIGLRHGGAAGLDRMARDVAEDFGMRVEPAWKPDY